MSCPATIGSAASALTGVKDSPSSARSSPSAAPSRATPTTAAPASLSAAAMPRPNPRLAPVTSAVVPLTSLLGITILPGVLRFPPPVVWRLIDVDQPEPAESPRAGLQRAPAGGARIESAAETPIQWAPHCRLERLGQALASGPRAAAEEGDEPVAGTSRFGHWDGVGEQSGPGLAGDE